MALQIPSEVVLFLNVCGVPYPDVNEDHIRELATHVRIFAANVVETHSAAGGAVKDMSAVYSGYSYQQLLRAWGAMSSQHMGDLERMCEAVAVALDAAAVVVVTVKAAVLAELATLAASYVSALGATVATSGLSATLIPAITEAGRRLCLAMEQTLVAYILAEVINRAIEPLEARVAQLLDPLVYRAACDALDMPADPTALFIEPDEVRRYADMLDRYADDMAGHASTLAAGVAPLDFSTRPDSSESIPVSTPPHSVLEPKPSYHHPLDDDPLTGLRKLRTPNEELLSETRPSGANQISRDTRDFVDSPAAPEQRTSPMSPRPAVVETSPPIDTPTPTATEAIGVERLPGTSLTMENAMHQSDVVRDSLSPTAAEVGRSLAGPNSPPPMVLTESQVSAPTAQPTPWRHPETQDPRGARFSAIPSPAPRRRGISGRAGRSAPVSSPWSDGDRKLTAIPNRARGRGPGPGDTQKPAKEGPASNQRHQVRARTDGNPPPLASIDPPSTPS
ncbi:hypothetical protein [Nocardia sp. NPDC057668]|uniref:WXG100-like domain-containing protein n=1 Tax=Nocardia sp. NPDC057668 TaxID=3346202 RepID=UPI0036704241